MNNLETACVMACEDLIKDVDVVLEPEYSNRHIRKIKTMSDGVPLGNRYHSKLKLKIIVACILVLAMSVVTFAYAQSQIKSNNLIFYEGDPVKVGALEFSGNIMVKTGGVNWKKYKPVDFLQCNWVPDGYKRIVNDNYMSKNGYGDCISRNVMFEKNLNETVTCIYVYKFIESTSLNVTQGSITLDDVSSNDVLNNSAIVEKGESIEAFRERITEFKSGDVIYYYVAFNDVEDKGGSMYWNYDGYLYFIQGEVSFDELKKIAENTK